MTATNIETIIVTRHAALLDYLTEIGIAPAGARVLSHATPDDVAGKRVVGVLPHRLSALAASVVEIPMDIPADLRGVELTLEQVRQYADQPVEYVVRTADIIASAVEKIGDCAYWARRGFDIESKLLVEAIKVLDPSVTEFRPIGK